MLPLLKTITFEVAGHEISGPVDFRMLEIVETVFDVSADMVVSVHLVTAAKIKRTSVARAVAEWLSPNLPDGMTKSELMRHIATLPPKDFGVVSGKLQHAIAYSLQYISEVDFDKIAGPSSGEAKKPGKKKVSSDDVTE